MFIGVRSPLSLLLLLGAAACGQEKPLSDRTEADTVPRTVSFDTGLYETYETPPATASELACAPDTLRSGDTLTLTMSVPHGQYLAVTQPGGSWFYLVSPQLLAGSPHSSLVPSDVFRTMASYRIPVDVRARPRVYGKTLPEAVFVQPGRYRVRIGENLPSDYGPPVTDCYVTYR